MINRPTGLCHIASCTAPATEICSICHRAFCAQHIVPFPESLAKDFGPRACVRCVEKAQRQVAKVQAQMAKKRAEDIVYRTCAVCGKLASQVLPHCSVCGLPVCAEHRVRYRRKFYWGWGERSAHGQWYWDRDVRCLRHRRRWPALQRWEVDPTTEVTEDRLGEQG